MSPTVQTALAVLVLAATVAAILRGFDVRLVMLLAAFALGALAGDVALIVRSFFNTFANEQFVIPICSAMGFAFVLRQSGCDQHLVRLLVGPVSRFRVLLVPAAVFVGCFVNIAVISQASTAVAVSTVLIPLMRSAGYRSEVAGAALLLGASIGGELLNPGAPELQSVSAILKVPATHMQPVLAPLLGLQFVVATLVFWWGCRREKLSPLASELAVARANPLKALVPLVPLVLLLVVGPPLDFVHVPEEWLLTAGRSGKYSSRLIGLSMLMGCCTTCLVSPSTVGQVAKAFFEGAGYAFTHIVSIIVTANCFGKGIEALRLADGMGGWIRSAPRLVWPLAGLCSLAFAMVCGSGMATTESLYRFFWQSGASEEYNLRIGAVVSIAAAAGRTASPAAAVVLLCASLVGVRPWDLLKRVAPPLFIAVAATALTAMAISRR